MTASISITREGNYLVSIFLRDGNGYGRWHELRCFRYQGDARDFAFSDVPQFTEKELELFAKTYDAGKVHARRAFKNYKSIAV